MRPDLRELVEMQFMVQDRKTVIGRTRSVVCLQAEILAQTGFCQIKRVLLHQDKHWNSACKQFSPAPPPPPPPSLLHSHNRSCFCCMITKYQRSADRGSMFWVCCSSLCLRHSSHVHLNCFRSPASPSRKNLSVTCCRISRLSHSISTNLKPDRECKATSLYEPSASLTNLFTAPLSVQRLYRPWRGKSAMRSSWLRSTVRCPPSSSRGRRSRTPTPTRKCSRTWATLQRQWRLRTKTCKRCWGTSQIVLSELRLL